MKNISRRTLGISAAALTSSAARRAAAQTAEFTLKVGHEAVEGHPTNERLVEAMKNVAKRTNGRVNIQNFPNNQLGGATDMLSQTRSGALEFTLLSSVIASGLTPVAAITGIGYAFPDYDHVWAAMDGDLGGLVRQSLARSNLFAAKNMWDLGFRQVANNVRPVNTPADLAGIKVRVAVGALFVSLFKTLGASPVSLNYSELYSSLQTRVIDGTENPLQIFVIGKFYEVLKYCSLTRHMWDGQWLLGNARAWARLPADMQVIVEEEFNAAALRQRADLREIDFNARSGLTAKGMIINDVDIVPFRSKLAQGGFYTEWKAKFEPQAWAMLEKYTGKIG